MVDCIGSGLKTAETGTKIEGSVHDSDRIFTKHKIIFQLSSCTKTKFAIGLYPKDNFSHFHTTLLYKFTNFFLNLTLKAITDAFSLKGKIISN